MKVHTQLHIFCFSETLVRKERNVERKNERKSIHTTYVFVKCNEGKKERKYN